jgi:hypothetical protein
MELATPSLRARSLTEAGRPKVARRPGFARAASVSERARSVDQVALFGEMCAEPLFVYFSKYIQICIRS